ncbi:MAG: glutamate synthase subunit alpha, partial [Gammaproteobacteria bacterium]|nr:glutamate synthase subunit alpha [Gammaproteobacteria bacterium]
MTAQNGSLPGRRNFGLPPKLGLYDPALEKDSCGIGFVCDIKGRQSRGVVEDALGMNCSMEHRGGIGYEKNTGDGAGILLGLPDRFLRRAAAEELGVELPARGHYGVGNVFLPTDAKERDRCLELLEREIESAGQQFLGWRELPIDPEGADIGKAARAAMPHMTQLFVGAGDDLDEDEFERRLYLIRKHATHLLRGDETLAQRQLIYICSLSSKVIIYKGMLTPNQMAPFFTDLARADFESHLAMVHSRFSTNTFPSWDRAQPNRFMCHNGEINTLLGNVNAMNAREGVLSSPLFGDDLAKLFPIVEPDCSDSGTFDNVLEFLLMTGRKLQEAVLMMIPEAWQQHGGMDAAKRAFYEYHSCLMEPWDGPASIAFTDGTYIGAVLDRNGLRPSRYYITDDDRCIMASEVGVVRVAPERVVKKGRLQPGRIFLIDFEQGRMIPDEEIKGEWAAARPYADWLERQRIELEELPPALPPARDPATLTARMNAFGYTVETMDIMLQPLVRELRDPLGSMGNDAALAVMSDKPRMLYDYFKQRFAQVTNPAIDSIREEVIMALDCYCGPERNLLETTEEHAHRLRIPHPILSNEELAAIRHLDYRGWKTASIDITYEAGSGVAGLTAALDRICDEAARAIDEGYSLIVLSDRAVGQERTPISALLAVGAVHHHLVETHARTRIGIIVETGEAREVHHHCLLTGYGADAINPYLAFEALWDSLEKGYFDDAPHVATRRDVVDAYRKGTAKGMLKVMAKMGISTLQS